MAIISDFSLGRQEDATLTVSMIPTTAIGAWNIQFQVQKRFGGISGLITLSTASGFIGNVSGMTITNSGNGVFSAQIRSVLTSGWDYGGYAYNFSRLDSGNRTILSEGFFLLYP